MKCSHGINTKHRSCERCEEITELETNIHVIKRKKESQDEEDFDFHEINLNRLHEEWVAQVRMYRHYAEKLAKARKEYEHSSTDCDVAKEDLKRVYAEVDLKVRKSPDLFNLDKITEKSVEHTVLVHSGYRKAQEDYYDLQRGCIDKKHKVGMLEAAVKTLDHRKKALEDAVQLRLANYFSEPRISNTVQENLKESAFNRKRSK